nr:MAG TPA: hypothetical protein [Bacteriophage sp.]
MLPPQHVRTSFVLRLNLGYHFDQLPLHFL